MGPVVMSWCMLELVTTSWWVASLVGSVRGRCRVVSDRKEVGPSPPWGFIVPRWGGYELDELRFV